MPEISFHVCGADARLGRILAEDEAAAAEWARHQNSVMILVLRVSAAFSGKQVWTNSPIVQRP